MELQREFAEPPAELPALQRELPIADRLLGYVGRDGVPHAVYDNGCFMESFRWIEGKASGSGLWVSDGIEDVVLWTKHTRDMFERACALLRQPRGELRVYIERTDGRDPPTVVGFRSAEEAVQELLGDEADADDRARFRGVFDPRSESFHGRFVRDGVALAWIDSQEVERRAGRLREMAQRMRMGVTVEGV
jgi:hypothetical protein